MNGCRAQLETDKQTERRRVRHTDSSASSFARPRDNDDDDGDNKTHNINTRARGGFGSRPTAPCCWQAHYARVSFKLEPRHQRWQHRENQILREQDLPLKRVRASHLATYLVGFKPTFGARLRATLCRVFVIICYLLFIICFVCSLI